MKKVWVETGGTGGIGLGAARKMAEDYIDLICDVNQEKIDAAVEKLRAEGGEVYGMLCDISDKAQTDALAKRAAELGPVQGVIQLAGLTPTFAPAPSILRVDTIGPMNINESFYEVMEAGSCILDICSSTAHFVPFDRYPVDRFALCNEDKEKFYDSMLELVMSAPEENNMQANMAYTWSRCFIYWYARQCAAKYGREKGIRVMTVSPGIIETEMSMADLKKGGDTENFDRTMSWTALGRPGSIEEVAFLFSTIIDERNSYLTGADIYFDGGADASGYRAQREWYPSSGK